MINDINLYDTYNTSPSAMSDIGCCRDINEDRYAVVTTSNSTTWIICDGMGGVAGGDLAAQLTIDSMRRILEQHADDLPADSVLKLAVEEANRVIVLRRQNPLFSKMGTTLVAVMEHEGQYDFVNVGDSRAYIIHKDNSITQVSRDHTIVQDLIDEGQLSREDALIHPHGHILTKCIGATPQISASCTTYWRDSQEDCKDPDTIVLCSDGLYSLVDEEELIEITNNYTPQESCARLVEIAKQRGGDDNITVITIPVVGILTKIAPINTRTTNKPQNNANKRKQKRKRNNFSSYSVVLIYIAFCTGAFCAFIGGFAKLIGENL